jgi:hypothetical protein
MLEKLVLSIMVTFSLYLSVEYKFGTDLISSVMQLLASPNQTGNSVATSQYDD